MNEKQSQALILNFNTFISDGALTTEIITWNNRTPEDVQAKNMNIPKHQVNLSTKIFHSHVARISYHPTCPIEMVLCISFNNIVLYLSTIYPSTT